ncbi:unnamed protein product [Ascophyllum nodosum]
MAEPHLRCQVTNAMITALSSISDGTCISDIATDMADVMPSTAAELAPRSKRPRGAQDWCAGSGVETKMNGAWQQREEVKMHLRAEPYNNNPRKTVKTAGKKLFKITSRTAPETARYHRLYLEGGRGAAAVELCHRHGTP